MFPFIEQEPSASEKFSDGTNIISNTNELVVIDDKAAKEELETQFNPAVEIGSGSNEDIENVTGKLAEVNNNSF